MRDAILRKARESAATKEQFFAAEADRILECCQQMLARFQSGGRLFAFGNGGSACDAAHVAVEFMHPLVEKRRALPAFALGNDSALLSALGNNRDFSLAFVEQLRLLAKSGDIALALSTSGKSANLNRALAFAREQGMLTVGFSGRDGGKMVELCDFCFTVQSFSMHRIQETHVTLYHVMWDLIHVLSGEEDVL